MKLSVRGLAGSAQRVMSTAQNGLEVIRFGGLGRDTESSPFEIAERRPMYRLRRYFPGATTGGPVALLVPPLMVNADIWDVNGDDGAVGILHRGGIDCWVIDFGSPSVEEGGWKRESWQNYEPAPRIERVDVGDSLPTAARASALPDRNRRATDAVTATSR